MKIRDEFKKATIVTGAGTISETEWQFSRWTKGDRDRVYVNYRGKKGYGYIDLVTGENHVDSNENAQEAVAMFLAEYGEKEPEQSGDWYAVEMDEDDNDWGTGSYSLEEAKEMAERMDAKYIAVIDGSECVEVIEVDPEPKDIVANIYKNVFDSDIAQENINSYVKAVIINFGDERGDIIVENDNFGTNERYADFTEGRKKAGLHPMQIVFTGLEIAHVLGDRYIGADDQIHKF